ncbi:conserved hypothetical protein [Citricoccus sp. K5]|nr:conserved hypothetical protein [Citricoccus sp. K5]VXA94262.1 conserved hypothetical protein [Citricoccus sp. K5]
MGGDGTWTDRDHLLTHAHTLYQRMLCPDCGRTLTECGSGAYNVQTRICEPSAAIQRWRKENKDPAPGIVLFAVPSEAAADSPTVASAPAWWREKYGTPTE